MASWSSNMGPIPGRSQDARCDVATPRPRCLFHKYTTSRKGRGNPCGCPRLGRHEACPYWRRTCEMDIWGPTALVHEQFEVVLRLPLAEPFLYRWRLLEPLPLVGGDAIDILWGSDDVRCQE